MSQQQTATWMKSIEALQASRNEAAVDVLIGALGSNLKPVQYAAMTALLKRKTAPAQLAIMNAWETIPDRIKVLVLDEPELMEQVLGQVFRGEHGDSFLPAAGEIALSMRAFGLIPDVLEAAERAGPHRVTTAQALLDLCEQFYDAISDGGSDKSNHYSMQRPQAIARLAVATERGSASIKEIVESLLVIADFETTAVRRILRDARHPAHRLAIDALLDNPRTAIIHLLIQFLSDPHAPKPALQCFSQRSDISFMRATFRQMAQPPNSEVRRNLAQIDSFHWVDHGLERVLGLQDEEQFGAMQMIRFSGMPKPEKFKMVRVFLQRATAGGRRAASLALAEFHTDEAHQLAVDAMRDNDPEVQANVIGQLRDRKIPGAMSQLIDALDSPHPVVRNAAQACLKEFNFRRYLAMFDSLSENARQSTGELVRKADPDVMVQLREELTAGERGRLIRALQVTVAMNLASSVEDLLVSRMADNDHFVRVEAARALGDCVSSAARVALREALMDSSVAVQQAAEESLQRVATQPPPLPTNTPFMPPIIQDWLR